jgi:hypothetical protein
MSDSRFLAPGDLHQQQVGNKTPLVNAPSKQLDPRTIINQVLYLARKSSTVSGSRDSAQKAAATPEGAESVISKAMPPSESAKRKHDAEEDDGDWGKNLNVLDFFEISHP